MATSKKNKENLGGLTERQKNILRLRKKLNAPDRDEIKVFTKYKIITYVFVILFPPYAIYRIWRKESPFNNQEKGIQTAVCVIYMIVLFVQLWEVYG